MSRDISQVVQPQHEQVLAEIEAVLNKHGLGGTIIVSSKDATSFQVYRPSWCQIDWNEEGVRIKFRKHQTELASASMHFLLSNRDCFKYLARHYERVTTAALHGLERIGVEVTATSPEGDTYVESSGLPVIPSGQGNN